MTKTLKNQKTKKLKNKSWFLRFSVFTFFGLVILMLGFASMADALTLKESVDIALKNNPSVLASQKKVDAANARLGQAVGVFFPTIKLDGNYGKAYTQPSTVQFTTQTATGAVTQTLTFGTDAATDTKGWTASLSQPLFIAGLFPGFKMAQRGADLAKEDLKKVVQETSYNVTVAYFGWLSAGKFVKLSEDSLQMAKSHQVQVESMLNSGVATKADLLRTEVQVANSEVALTKAKNAFELAKSSFNTVLGRNLDEKVELMEEAAASLPRLPENEFLLKTAFENRPDWKQFLYTKQVAEENLSLARTVYLPTVLLTGQTGNRVTEYPTYKSDVNSWNLVGVASWTLFDGLGIQNRIREAAANFEAQKATEEQVKNGIAFEIRDAYLNLKSAMETIGSAKKAVDFAEESQKVSTLRFNSGVGTNIEVMDAQVALTQAKTNYLKALFDLETAKAKINKVVGKEVFKSEKG